MKAIAVNDYGGPEVLTLTEIPKPVAGIGQVVVRVHATSFNPIDLKRVSGKMRDALPIAFPFIPGGDFSGVVDSIGPNIVGYHPGVEVYGDTFKAGAYAEYLAVSVDCLTLKPTSLTHIESASLALVAQTAAVAFEKADLRRGQTVLILGAGGAVGSAAVQLAHDLGAYVIASASGASLDRLKQYGADQVVDYKTTPFESVAKNVDVVLDGIGGDVQQRSYATLKPGGILVAIAQPPSQEEAASYGVRALMFSTQSSSARLQQLNLLIESGKLKPFVGRVYPLSEAAQAWRDISAKQTEGKVVFTVA